MELNLIDTHSHLYAAEFEEDIEEVVSRAHEVGVKTILLPNIDRDSVDPMKKLVDKWPTTFKPMMGLHPSSVKQETYRDELAVVENELFTNGDMYIGVGEIGMDLYWDTSTKHEQEEAFKTQCRWADQLNLPIAIHSRNATQNVIDIIQELKLPNLTGVFHCFGDGPEEARQIIDLGFKLGIGGVLTFKNSGLDKTMADIELDHCILETDSPYLAPTPNRGKRNESSYTALVAQKLADVKQTSLENVAKITSQNAKELFRI